MSGGSMNYCYEKLYVAARETSDPVLKALLEETAQLLHDEEWWISSDIGFDDYKNTRRLFYKKWLRKKWRDK